MKFEKVSEQNGLNGLQMFQFEWPRDEYSSVTTNFGVGQISFSHYWLWGNRKLLPIMNVRKVKKDWRQVSCEGCKHSRINATCLSLYGSSRFLQIEFWILFSCLGFCSFIIFMSSCPLCRTDLELTCKNSWKFWPLGQIARLPVQGCTKLG